MNGHYPYRQNTAPHVVQMGLQSHALYTLFKKADMLQTSRMLARNGGCNDDTVKSAYADVAQLAEQLICNQQVIGSSPITGLLSDGYDNKVVRG